MSELDVCANFSHNKYVRRSLAEPATTVETTTIIIIATCDSLKLGT